MLLLYPINSEFVGRIVAMTRCRVERLSVFLFLKGRGGEGRRGGGGEGRRGGGERIVVTSDGNIFSNVNEMWRWYISYSCMSGA